MLSLYTPGISVRGWPRGGAKGAGPRGTVGRGEAGAVTSRLLTVNEGKVRCYAAALPTHLHPGHLGFLPH